MTLGNNKIKLVGIGGCGSTVVDDLLLEENWEADCVVLTTDNQTKRNSSAQQVIKVDERVFEPASKGQETERDELKVKVRQSLRGSEVVVITAGMGSGTSGRLGILVAEIAQELNCLVIAFVTTPFAFEGESRQQQANEAIDQLQSIAHATVVLSNRRLLHSLGHKARMTDAFNASANVFKDAFRGIRNMVNQNGLINLDLADLRVALVKKGLAVIGRGEAQGENKAETAILKAIFTPLLENRELKNAQTLIVTLQVSNDFSIGDLEEIGLMLRNLFEKKVDVLIGVTLDKQLHNSVVATVLATGIPNATKPMEPPAASLKMAWYNRE